jgi:elongation factor Ts
MMGVTSEKIKALREATGAGFMDCKQYLSKSDGDIQEAIKLMREGGQAKATKKATRMTSEGMVVALVNDHAAVLLEANSETDFVALNQDFQDFVSNVAAMGLERKVPDLEALLQASFASGSESCLTVDDARLELVLKLGENIQLRRYAYVASTHKLAHYHHGRRIAVIVDYQGGDGTLGHDIAMHIAAMNPMVVAPNDVDAGLIEKEEAIVRKQAEDSGKPAAIVDKMIAGRIKKYLNEIALTGQSFVKDQDMTVGQLLSDKQAQVARFIRFEVGEGIEKNNKDFAQEVMEQVKEKR